MTDKPVSVRVCVRIRPVISEEGKCNVITQCLGRDQIVVNKEKPFTFDQVFDISATQV
jgi:hypothetical protein